MKNVGKKKSKFYAMKGGAPLPLEYDGESLTEGNRFTHIAVTQDGVNYNFDIPAIEGGFISGVKAKPGVRFERFCDLFSYYQQNSPISCANQTFKSKVARFRIAPSLVEILGISLIIHKIISNNGTIDITNLLTNAFVGLLLQVNSGESICVNQSGDLVTNPNLKSSLLTSIKNFYPGMKDLEEIEPPRITKFDKIDIVNILTYFKQALCFYRYNVIFYNGHIKSLTFQEVFDETEALRFLKRASDTAAQTFEINQKEDYFTSNKFLYTEGRLRASEGPEGPKGLLPEEYPQKDPRTYEIIKLSDISPDPNEAINNIKYIAFDMKKLGARAGFRGPEFRQGYTPDVQLLINELMRRFEVNNRIARQNYNPVRYEQDPMGRKEGTYQILGGRGIKRTNKNRRTRRMKKTRKMRRTTRRY